MAEPSAIPTQMDQWVGIRLAHEAMMLGDAAAVLRQSRQGVKDHAAVNGIGNVAQEADEVIHVGDVYQQAPQAAAPTVQQPSLLATVAKLGIGAGLMATGIGAPVAAWMLASGTKDVVKEVVAPTETPKPAERPAVNIGGYELRLGK